MPLLPPAAIMASIQLPPLQFDDSGFRVSIITGHTPTAEAPVAPATEADAVSDATPTHAAAPALVGTSSETETGPSAAASTPSSPAAETERDHGPVQPDAQNPAHDDVDNNKEASLASPAKPDADDVQEPERHYTTSPGPDNSTTSEPEPLSLSSAVYRPPKPPLQEEQGSLSTSESQQERLMQDILSFKLDDNDQVSAVPEAKTDQAPRSPAAAAAAPSTTDHEGSETETETEAKAAPRNDAAVPTSTLDIPDFSAPASKSDSLFFTTPGQETRVSHPPEEREAEPAPEPEPIPESALESAPDPAPAPEVVFKLDMADDDDGSSLGPQAEFPAPPPRNEARTAPAPSPSPSPSPPPVVVPTHPIESLKMAFAESLEEATRGNIEKPKLRDLDTAARRERLLAQDKDDSAFDSLWRYRPGQREHEVLKLIAQISFGVYLLLNGMANDDAQVVAILQGHINEMDEFLEVTLEDMAHTSTDLTERLRLLKLPMSNMKVFEDMLEDRNYRAEILEGNEKLDHVLSRTDVAMKQWDDDVDAGLQASTSFTEWLNSMRNGDWRRQQPHLIDIFDAMKGNAEGWLAAFDDINARSQDLNAIVINLVTIIAEMERKAGEVSRKMWSAIPPFTSPTSMSLHSKNSKKDNTSSISSPHSLHSQTRSTAGSTSRQASSYFDAVEGDHASRTSHGSGVGARGSDYSAIAAKQQAVHTPVSASASPPVSQIMMPPPRASARLATRRSSGEGAKLRVETATMPSPVHEASAEEESEDSPLYTLQPRTYTPKTPQPSPLARHAPSTSSMSPSSPPSPPPGSGGPWRGSGQSQTPSFGQSRPSQQSIPVRASVAQERSPVRASPAVRATPRMSGTSGAYHSNNNSLSPGSILVRDSVSSGLPFRDSASSGLPFRDSSGSDAESFGPHGHRVPRVGSHLELRHPSSQGAMRPTMLPSHNSDYQHYHPVLASPHSPLQQRPHTAAGGGFPNDPQARAPSGYFSSQAPTAGSGYFHQPSMSTLNSSSTATPGNTMARSPGATPSARSGGSRTVRKKKSTFGWLKKAFTMDDDERAAFEARKAAQYSDTYYKDRDPKFLDGKRIR